MSTNAIYQAVLQCIADRDVGAARDCRARHLDVGAGRGELIRAIGRQHAFDSMACDFHVERFGVEGIDCEQLDLNCDDLPYRDATFDVVTCSEVVEHLENYRRLTREMFRVATPGGYAVVTTPNVLNAKSRIRYLCSGFANLFGPLPTRNDKRYSTGGHITPIPYFYLAHALLDAGFVDLELTTDKTQRTSVFWSLWVAPVALLGRRIFVSRERRFDTITPENKVHVDAHFSWRISSAARLSSVRRSRRRLRVAAWRTGSIRRRPLAEASHRSRARLIWRPARIAHSSSTLQDCPC